MITLVVDPRDPETDPLGVAADTSSVRLYTATIRPSRTSVRLAAGGFLSSVIPKAKSSTTEAAVTFSVPATDGAEILAADRSTFTYIVDVEVAGNRGRGRGGATVVTFAGLLPTALGATVQVTGLENAEPLPAPFVSVGELRADVAAAQTAATSAAASAASSAALVGAPAGTAIDAHLASTVVRRAGAGSFTTGDVIKLGAHAYITRTDTGTSVVAGGAPNNENVVGGNLANVDTATSNLTGAPTLTAENGNWNFLLGGYDTVVNGWANSVVGFHCKVGVDANHCTIGGGSRANVAASTAYGTIGGGTANEIAGNNPTVGGGNTNKATANGATIGGGQTNQATGTGATVTGGVANTASGANSTIGGGSSNVASGNSATVVGGLSNTAAGTAAVAVGRDNTATAHNSFATGRGAVTVEEGQQAHASTPFTTPGDAQINRWSLKKQTTDATAGNLEASAGVPPTIPENTTWAFSALVVARRADVDGDNAAWEVKGCFKRDTGNTAAFVGTPTVTALGASAGAAAWTLTVGSFSAGTLRLIVTGEAAKTVRWVAELRAASATG